jgi:hypothetical protein
MKLKATKYLLPTTEGRLHKELSYLIFLHENKMNKGKLENRISDLDNRVSELSHKIEQLLMVNRKELPFSKANIKHPNDGGIELFNMCDLKKGDVIDKNGKLVGTHVESTQELFTSEDDNHKNPTFIIAPTPETITSTTLKTPNEWLKLMSEEEVKLWRENIKSRKTEMNMETLMTFERFISNSFVWSQTTQGLDYWQNISNRYNN